MVNPRGPRRESVMKGYNKVHVTDEFEYVNMWQIISILKVKVKM